MAKLIQAVLAEVEGRFEPAERVQARAMLVASSCSRERPEVAARVHLAALWLAGGDLNRLEQVLASAAGDWRDTLVAGGLAGENWPEVLVQRGVEFDLG